MPKRILLSESQLRRIIRQALLESREAHDEEKDEKLLLEPDSPDEGEEQNEMNAISTGGGAMQSSGAIRGVTTPLGTGPTYPVGRKKKKKKKAFSGGTDWYKVG